MKFCFNLKLEEWRAIQHLLRMVIRVLDIVSYKKYSKAAKKLLKKIDKKII